MTKQKRSLKNEMWEDDLKNIQEEASE